MCNLNAVWKTSTCKMLQVDASKEEHLFCPDEKHQCSNLLLAPDRTSKPGATVYFTQHHVQQKEVAIEEF